MLQAVAIDRDGALDFMDSWKQFLQDSGSEEKFNMASKSWENWVQYRCLDAALT